MLKGDHRKVYCVHVQDSKSDLIDNVIQLAKVKNIPVVFQSKMAMNKISKDKPHQGVIVDATAIQPVMMEPHGPEGSCCVLCSTVFISTFQSILMCQCY